MHSLAKILLLFIGLSGVAQAATISFNPEDSFVGLNDIFIIDIVGGDSFPETQGGGVNLFYDETIVNVLSISIDNLAWNFVNNEGVINNTVGEVSDILVSAFNGSGFDPSNNFIVATLELQAVGLGVSALSMTESTINPWASNGNLVNPTFLPGSITVTMVPLPGAIVLFGSGLLLLMAHARRRV